LTSKKLSKYSDVWSFGVTCWEVFSKAELPYSEKQTNAEVAEYVFKGKRLEQPKGCSGDLWKIYESCWLEQAIFRPSFEVISGELIQAINGGGKKEM
jgi:hypothetical protein